MVFLSSLLLARTLADGDFQVYVVAASLFALLAAMASLGADQLILKVIPLLNDCDDHDGWAAFRAFVLKRAVFGTLCAALAGAAWLASTDPGPQVRAAVFAALLGLPLAVAVGIGVELMTVLGRPTRGVTAKRLVLPGTMLAVFGLLAFFDMLPGSTGTVALWGIGWVAALAVVLPGFRAFSGPVGAPERPGREEVWARMTLPLWGRRAAAAFGAQAGILAVGSLGPEPGDVAAMAIAASAAGLVLIPATMTHRVYARDLAPLVRRRDTPTIKSLLLTRARRIAPASGLAIAVMLIFPGQIIALFGYAPDASSIAVLRLLVLSAGVVTALGILSVLHVYAGRGRVVSLCLAAGLMTQITGLVLLVPTFGALGAAASQLAATLAGLLPLALWLPWQSTGWREEAA